jgi:hypothetical protein
MTRGQDFINIGCNTLPHAAERMELKSELFFCIVS